MFDKRQKGDYADYVVFENDDVKEWLSEAEGFIAVIDVIVRKNLEE